MINFTVCCTGRFKLQHDTHNTQSIYKYNNSVCKYDNQISYNNGSLCNIMCFYTEQLGMFLYNLVCSINIIYTLNAHAHVKYRWIHGARLMHTNDCFSLLPAATLQWCNCFFWPPAAVYLGYTPQGEGVRVPWKLF